MTWPFENDTSDIEKKLAKRSLHRERQRNLFAIIALVLTAFMITATFSIGFSYFETYQMEGFYYWGVSLSLAVTIGTAIFILLYMIFSKVAYYAVFSYPFIPLVLVSGLVLLICLIVPIWVYKTDVNLPVVERLRLTE